MKKQLLSLGAVCLALVVSSNLFAQELEVLESVAPTVDGYVDDGDPWQDDNWVALDAANANNSTTDMSSEFQIAHDFENIFLVIRTQDGTQNSDADAIPNSYERDCSEIFFSMHAYVEGENAYAPGDWQIRIQRGAADEASYIDGSGDVATVLVGGEGFEWAVEDDGVEYITEAIFPIALLDQGANFDGENLTFELQAADNTTGAASGRTQQQFWLNNSDSQWNDISTFSAIHLSDEDLVGIKKIEKKPEVLAYINGGIINVKGSEGKAIEVFDMTGKSVAKGEAISADVLRKGMYIVVAEEAVAKLVVR